jgi:hypothetical protein
MTPSYYKSSFHDQAGAKDAGPIVYWDTQFTYTFQNFFHPFVGELKAKLNRSPTLAGMLDAKWQHNLRWLSLPGQDPESPPKDDFDTTIWPNSKQPGGNYFTQIYTLYDSKKNDGTQVEYFPKEIDVSSCGPYANYNWELFFHIPLMLATHLSKNQRFAEAQRWFHYIFDPTSNDPTVDPPQRFWNFLAFRYSAENSMRIEDIVLQLSKPADDSEGDPCDRQSILEGYLAILNKPFKPHAVARTRPIAYQYNVVMKYLDNLIAWGDNLFQQDTIESINEATQVYVLAANVLGDRPQQIPPMGTVKPMTFAQLKAKGLGPIGDVLVDLEGHFPFNMASAALQSTGGTGDASPLFGIGRALYFCVPKNDKLLGYWDTVGDRLFKIRHGLNIAGLARPLALFDPPIDPGMLVKAAAAGVDIGSILSGLNQPIGPVRCTVQIQKALELAAEVRSLGGALLAALEKGDAEHLALIRQRHEIQIQQMVQETRFLQWKAAQEATTSLLTSRGTTLERLHYYQRLLGLPADPNAADDLPIDHSEAPDDAPKLNEENFDAAYAVLVGQYDKKLTLQDFPKLRLAGDSSPGILSGLLGSGKIYLNENEDTELNTHSPAARDKAAFSAVLHSLAAPMTVVPDAAGNVHFWGLGGTIKLPVGKGLVQAARIAGDLAGIHATWERDQAAMAAKFASYERRADEWLFQYNLAAHEVMQIGRQVLTSLISEQVAHHEYLSVKQQIANAQEIQAFLDAVNFPDRAKFTNEHFYLWMQGEITGLYYEYYRFACDTARKAEKTMKQELMRPELDAQDFIQYNYWDGGRKGLLSGEALHLDVKRMEMAYLDNNKRELELTKHVSLRQLNPLALLTLRGTGSCQVDIPEWLFDLDCPGHYMRRIKSVALSIPSVVGPYSSVNCTLLLLKSSVRKSGVAGDYYARQGSEDDRFVDYMGGAQSIVTSSAQSDSGMFEANLRDERFLPFEGAGVVSSWKLDLPSDYRTFDYAAISDVIFQIRYTARQGMPPHTVARALGDLFQDGLAANEDGLWVLLSLRHEFPTGWSAFVNGDGNFTATVLASHFPYFAQQKQITITGMELYAPDVTRHHPVGQTDWDNYSTELKDKQAFSIDIPQDQVLTRKQDAEVFLIIKYSLDK